MDIPHIKLFTQNILTCIPTHNFDKKHDRSKYWGISQLNPTLSLLLTPVLSSTLDSRNNKDILLVVGFNYNIYTKLYLLIHLNYESAYK